MSNYTNEESVAPMYGKKLDDQNHASLNTISRLPTQLSTGFDPIQRIKEGFNYFKINEFDKQPDYYNKLEEKQEPKFLIFACSDSRVSPTNILNLRPGEALMARNIANMVPAINQLKDLGVGSIIQAATILFKVEVIMVIGHRRCGGIHRLINLSNEEPHDLIDDWLTIGQPVKAKVIAEHPNASDEELHILIEKVNIKSPLG
ncbi:carbonic anhydrase-like [Rutidosis leptorrhynchoides]|uniref:carbonic anhydrase-like n=1 Tax=Rutidosis leptorrhynchoides TaxID=125765 RepID=UPI003A99398C